MEQLKINGLVEIEGMKFHSIEGGFGEGKRCILVKDIADIHNRNLFKLNELINNNRKRFKDSIDIIDFLNPSQGYRDFAKENNLIGSNRTKNVYLLSERGYSKLLKIMDDDFAWEKYDDLVDNYFNMRQTLNTLSEEQRLQLAIFNAKDKDEAIINSSELDRYRKKQLKDKDDLLLIAGQKTSLTDDWLNTDNLYTVDVVAKTFGIKGLGRNNFYKYLRENKIIMTDTYINKKGKECAGAKHYESYGQYCNNQQYFKHRQREITIGFKNIQQNVAMFTPKGIQWIYKRLQKDEYINTKNLETIISELEQDMNLAS
ncbi:phage antirepressor KilAC domain-containing protein [Clostridium botulinum]|uniref:phage antirepressor KilAC domain-containing protein n=1 Tax=Clostridium botulinum TaxID=1491 RepID=UPI001967EC1A|nr:phage antirepressor KilAC domain-containing protein [Clostridium botulinum]